jgi:hypothetical protein
VANGVPSGLRSASGFFYTGLAFVGMSTGHPAMLGMQPFDHPFHFLLGGLGLLAVGLDLYRARNRKQVSS